MDIGSIQFNANLQKEIIGKAEEQKTKDFDEVFKKAVASKDDKALKDACTQLETYMLTELFKNMKKSMISEESLIPKGDYEKSFEDYMLTNQCEKMSKAGGIGLADMMYKQMTNAYNKQVKPSIEGENQPS